MARPRPMENAPMRKTTRTVWHYSGDVNIEHGGMFYSLANFEFGYVDAVRVTPCSDAGGPDNVFWVEQLTINVGDAMPFQGVGCSVAERRAHRVLHDQETKELDRIERAMECCGWDERLHEWLKMSEVQRKHAVVQACADYGYTETDSQETVQVGPSQENAEAHRIDKVRADKVLRGNASLKNYARSKCP
jgi:hypothetical protein